MPMLETAIQAARAAGAIQKEHFGSVLQVDEDERHDLKLKVDKLCEEAIIKIISAAFPTHAILAEESGASGESAHRWIIDPLDGTVNFYYGIPHFCTSVALEVEGKPQIGVIYDPIREELFAAERGKGATLNQQGIRVSAITDPAEASIVLGFMKDDTTMRAGLKAMEACIYRVRKVRCTGSAALDLAYLAAGRFTGYYEAGIHHWDIAAGRAILLEAGGRFEQGPEQNHAFNVFASNGGIHEALKDAFPLEV